MSSLPISPSFSVSASLFSLSLCLPLFLILPGNRYLNFLLPLSPLPTSSLIPCLSFPYVPTSLHSLSMFSTFSSFSFFFPPCSLYPHLSLSQLGCLCSLRSLIHWVPSPALERRVYVTHTPHILKYVSAQKTQSVS